jgi:hypothetical protein
MELSVRSRAEALDAALSAPAVPAQADGVAREVALVALLRSAGESAAARPTDEFRDALRTRLVAVGTVQGVGVTATSSPRPAAVSWRQRAAAVAVGAMASAVAVTGVAAASSQSLPGDPFYGVKRTTEDVQLHLAHGATAQGTRHLQFAATRLRELRELAFGRDLSDRDGALTTADTARVDALLADMDAETRAAARLLTTASQEGRDDEPLRQLARFADQQRQVLLQVVPVLPGGSAARARGSIALVTAVRARTQQLLDAPGCTAACNPAGAAPVVPGGAGAGPCTCLTPAPGASGAPGTQTGTSTGPGTTARPGTTPAPGASSATSPEPSSSTGSPKSSPAPGPSLPPLPVPTVPTLPLPVPVPTLPLPLPTVSSLPLQVPGVTGSGGPLSGLVGAVAPLVPGGTSLTLGQLAALALRSLLP